MNTIYYWHKNDLQRQQRHKELLSIMPDEILCDNPYLQRATARKKGCQIDYLIQTKHNNLYVCEIKFTRTIIKKDIIDEVAEKIKRLQIPRHTSTRAVLIYLGDIHDEVLDANYFSNVINVEDFMSD